MVGSAADGDEALALCERERPDALTLDLAMPGLDGIGVLRALRQQGGSDMPVVVVSAFSPAQGARAVDALAEGAFDLVAKPAVGEGLDAFADEPGRQGRGRRRRGLASAGHAARRRDAAPCSAAVATRAAPAARRTRPS